MIGMFSYYGGLLWVDFINTERLEQGQVEDMIPEFPLFERWLQEAGFDALPEPAGVDGEQALQKAAGLRRQLRKMAEELTDPAAVPGDWAAFLNGELAAVKGHWQIADGKAVFVPDGSWLLRALWPVLQSAMLFWTEGDRARLKACSNHACIKYYYDTSKNGTRRWCRMETCGNRAKARRHYSKRKGESQDE